MLQGWNASKLDTVLIRKRAWWFNKVPLSVTLMLLLLDGRPFTVEGASALVLLVLTVCAVGNAGYAMNELYDIEEDARGARANAAATLGRQRLREIIVASAVVAALLAWAAASWLGAALTFLALSVTLAYSRPPWRIKERKWLGVAADALSAHVYPASLALLSVAHWGLRAVPAPLVISLLAWSAAVGLRGILSHQLHTAEQDRQGGLTTVVHDYGAPQVERLIAWVLLPIEVTGFIGALLICDSGIVLYVLAGIYLAYEAFKTLAGGFVVIALRRQGQPYIPLVEESFYKAWGPIVIALDAARIDWKFLVMIPVYWVLFEPHMQGEIVRFRAVGRACSRFRRWKPQR